MSTTQRLIAKVLTGVGTFVEARRLGVTESTFLAEEEKAVWRLVDKYYTTHGNIPEYPYVHKMVPTFTPPPPTDRTVSELVEQVQKFKTEVLIQQAIAQVQSHVARENFHEAINALHKAASEASRGYGVSKDLRMNVSAAEVLANYNDRKINGIMNGIPFPWNPLNLETGGIQNGSYSVLYGRPKSTKTFRLLQMAISARMAGKKALIVSCEMPSFDILKRLVAIELELPIRELEHGQLSPESEMMLEAYVEDIMQSDRGNEVAITQLTDNGEGRTVSALRSKIDEYEPDIVLVDAMYKMQDEQTKLRDGSPQTMRNVSFDMQQLAQRTNIPVVVSVQANRTGSKTKVGDDFDDVAFSDALAMDCDLLMRIVNDKDLGRTVFIIKAMRNGDLDGFSVGNKICTGLGPVIGPDGVPDWSIPLRYTADGDPADNTSGQGRSAATAPGGMDASSRYRNNQGA